MSLASKTATGAFIVAGRGDTPELYPITAVESAIPRSDLVLLSSLGRIPGLRSLPVSPYPAPSQTGVRAHMIVYDRPAGPGWSQGIGGTWRKWVPGMVLGYRDFAGRETEVRNFFPELGITH